MSAVEEVLAQRVLALDAEVCKLANLVREARRDADQANDYVRRLEEALATHGILVYRAAYDDYHSPLAEQAIAATKA